MTSIPYEFITLDGFGKRLQRFPPKDKEKIKDKIDEMLKADPYRFPMLRGQIPIAGLRIFGLRHMKVGVSGSKGGAYILYRICDECKKNQFHTKSDAPCAFCDGIKDNHIVLFDVGLRSDDYSK